MESDLSHKALRPDLKSRLAGLAAEVDATRRSDGLREVLRTAARFWEYPPFNQFLIVVQRPGAKRNPPYCPAKHKPKPNHCK